VTTIRGELPPLGIEPWFGQRRIRSNTVRRLCRTARWLTAWLFVGAAPLALALWCLGRYGQLAPDAHFLIRHHIARKLCFAGWAAAVFTLNAYGQKAVAERLRALFLGGLPVGRRLLRWYLIWAVSAFGLAGLLACARFPGCSTPARDAGFLPFIGQLLREGVVVTAIAICAIQGVWHVALVIDTFVGRLRRTAGFAVLEEFLPEKQPLATGTAQRLCVAHWTDTHLTGSDGTPLLYGLQRGRNAVMRDVIRQWETVLDESDLLLISGDITDAGLAEEWKAFFDDLPEHLRAKAVICPGNHDINIVDPLSRFASGTSYAIPRRLRLLRWIAAMDMIQGERASIVDETGELVPLRRYFLTVAPHLRSYVEEPPYKHWLRGLRHATDTCEDLPDEVWSAIFPMVVDIPGSNCKVFVLDSTDYSLTIMTNAFGRLGEEQLARLRRLFELHPDTMCIIALHHHAGLPGSFDRGIINRVSTLIDARPFFAVLPNGRHGVLFNGHRHWRYMASFEDRSHVVSGPSTTFGESRPGADATRAGFGSYDIVWTRERGAFIEAEHWHPVAVAEERRLFTRRKQHQG